MLFKIIDKNEVPSLLRGFAQRFEVIGPVQKGTMYAFERLNENVGALCIDYGMTALPPKAFLTAPVETLFTFDTANNAVVDEEVKAVPRVLFGLHACDINAINRLDRVFLEGDFPDPYYKAQREATIIVGVSCTPRDTCMCAITGTSEVTYGYDLFLHDLGDRYLVNVLSVRAAEILAVSTSARDGHRIDSYDFQAKMREFHEKLPAPPQHYQLSMLMDALYESSVWEDIAEGCLSCSACSMVCPTCHCFDISDQLDPNGQGGKRVRTWDSCCSPAFATVTGGHNFRAKVTSRVKNRFYHKFMGYRSRYGEDLCTGCGRCVTACKAHINPRSVIEAMTTRIEQPGGHKVG